MSWIHLEQVKLTYLNEHTLNFISMLFQVTFFIQTRRLHYMLILIKPNGCDFQFNIRSCFSLFDLLIQKVTLQVNFDQTLWDRYKNNEGSNKNK